MSELVCKTLTVDTLFDACDLIDAIGLEEILKVLDMDEIAAVQATGDAGDVGVAVAAELSAVVVRNIGKAKTEICTFFAHCMKWDDKPDPVTADDIRALNLMKFISLIKEFFTQDEIGDFFGGLLVSLGMGQTSSGNVPSTDTGQEQNPT